MKWKKRIFFHMLLLHAYDVDGKQHTEKKAVKSFFCSFYSSHKISTMNSDDPLFGRFSHHSQMNRRRRRVSYPISLWKIEKLEQWKRCCAGTILKRCVFSSIIFDRENCSKKSFIIVAMYFITYASIPSRTSVDVMKVFIPQCK